MKRGGNLRHTVVFDEAEASSSGGRSSSASNDDDEQLTKTGRPHLLFVAQRQINIGDDLYYNYGNYDNPKIVKDNPWLKDYMKRGMPYFFKWLVGCTYTYTVLSLLRLLLCPICL